LIKNYELFYSLNFFFFSVDLEAHADQAPGQAVHGGSRPEGRRTVQPSEKPVSILDDDMKMLIFSGLGEIFVSIEKQLIHPEFLTQTFQIILVFISLKSSTDPGDHYQVTA
jgi:hypothetical protein